MHFDDISPPPPPPKKKKKVIKKYMCACLPYLKFSELLPKTLFFLFDQNLMNFTNLAIFMFSFTVST